MGEQDVLGLANEAQPVDVAGSKIGRKYTIDDVLSYVEIPTRFVNGATVCGKRNLVIDQGRIDAAMQEQFEVDVAATQLAPEDSEYPKKGDPSAAWSAAVTQIEGGATAQQVLDGLKAKAWGKRMLKACWKA